MRILVFDNYDSFTYNLVHLVEKLVHQTVDVRKNDTICLQELENYDKIIFSPGPGIPDEAGLLKQAIRDFGAHKSILGVCLGHQAIGEVYGGQLKQLKQVFHGVSHEVTILDHQEKLFRGMGGSFLAGRYHSWVVDESQIPEELVITATDEWGHIMGLRHRHWDVRGVQFHPESILTPQGEKIISNWLFE